MLTTPFVLHSLSTVAFPSEPLPPPPPGHRSSRGDERSFGGVSGLSMKTKRPELRVIQLCASAFLRPASITITITITRCEELVFFIRAAVVKKPLMCGSQ